MYALIFGSKKPEGLSIAQRKAEYNEAFRQSLTY
jgi:hypothetical protein